MAWYWWLTIVVVTVAVGAAAGYFGYQMQHGCTVDQNGKATCTK